MSLQAIIEISNRYGSNPDCVLAGGGNTSFKDETYLYVKGSGASLATIGAEGFVRMERASLAVVMDKSYSGTTDEVEAEVLSDLMNARARGEEGKRPSVEALLHAIFPQKLVLHLHPAMMNGVTCSAKGKETVEALFGGEAIWIDEIRPGYTLAKEAKRLMDDYAEAQGEPCRLMILQNHGVFFAADNAEELDALFERVTALVRGATTSFPDLSEVESDREAVCKIAPVLRMFAGGGRGGFALFHANKALLALMEEPDFAEITSFSPDHIVYCKHRVLLTDADGAAADYAGHAKAYGEEPRIVAVKGLGVFALGASMKEAETAADVFSDAVKIAYYSRSFGGRRYLSPEMVSFIRNWEVESYRSKVAAVKATQKRLDGKIALVTGGAQGFGEGIATELCREGAHVVIADLNGEGALACAARLRESFGRYAATAVTANVSEEDSVKAMIEHAVLTYGGLDLLVSNAGILRSGGLEELDFKTFELMTKVNYSAYFLCVKYASRVMKQQQSVAPDYFTDIIQINSKSGLVGSNKNFAYAGGKFGGIGLTESFALELVPYNIKVNAICPGNFYEGPLWNDPEKGLFVQYLRSGKVPGAKNVEDVRRFYEDKCPMRRGCTALDVARAIFYAVEQQYETGQAIPVTGGQTMLH